MLAVGAGALEKTSMALKSVWVDSVEVGPRSLVWGTVVGVEERRWWVVERGREVNGKSRGWGGWCGRCE